MVVTPEDWARVVERRLTRLETLQWVILVILSGKEAIPWVM